MKIAPNRITIYLTAAVDITAALASVFADLDGPQVATVATALVTLNGLAVMFLKGWQQYESALYQGELIAQQQVAAIERTAAAQQVGKAGSRKPSVQLPR